MSNLEFGILPHSHDLGPFNYAFSLARIKMSTTPWRPELVTIVPVSYTHLDVYKRQIEN